jgi:ABC-type antimicrobial peptide transport system permease subunit
MVTHLRLQLKIMVVALRQSGFRSVVALAAVSLGIASMMIMMALEAGATRRLEELTSRVGKNLLMVKAAEVVAPAIRGSQRSLSTRLSLDDAALLEDRVVGVATVVPIAERSVRVELGRESLVTTVRGVTPGYLPVRRFEIEEGRALDESDARVASRVAVVGAFVAGRLGDGASLVGESVAIGGVPFEVVGQLRAKGASLEGQNEDDQVLIPVDTAMRRLYDVDYLSRLLIQVDGESWMTPVRQEVRTLLRESHGLHPDVEDDFDVLAMIRGSEIDRMSSTFLENMARLFALVTLSIGGAGILAVTFLNVKDRTSEIGLRMAVGARRKDIARLFVVEACLLSLLGGVAGVVLGSLSVVILRTLTEWTMAIDFRSVAIPFVVSAALGLIFGVVPALRASRVMPVEALEYG